ncbi:ATP-binding protein [Mucilaginibacter angelicae]|uniref:histidine kinase n=1 Tax=Mucilaginibacter angelicae TaxID=869718 RepID=A0ABV6L5U4_9SPHI
MIFRTLSLKYRVAGLLLLISLSVSAQKKELAHIDSLLRQLPAAKEDTNKVNLLLKLGNTYSTGTKTDSSIFYLQRALLLAQRLKWQKGITRAYYDLGAYHFHKAPPDYVKAQSYLAQAAELSFKIEDYQFAYKSVVYLAGAIHFQNKGPQAINYLASAAVRFKKCNQIGPLINIYATLGTYYQGEFNYAAAMDYYDKALKLQETTQHNYLRGYDVGAMAGLYFNLHNIKKAKALYLKAIGMDENDMQAGNESAVAENYVGLALCADAEHDDAAVVSYYDKAIQAAKKGSHYNTLCDIENNASWHYFLKKDYDKAYVHAKRSLSYIKADEFYLIYAYGTLGAIYREAPASLIKKAGFAPGRQYQEALALTLKAINYGKTHDDAVLVTDNLKELSLTYEKMNRHADALKTYKAYIAQRDTADSLKNEKAILLKEAQLVYSRKEDALKYQQNITNAQLKQKKLQSYFFIGGLAALLLLSLFIGLNYYNQRKSNKLLAEANDQVTNANLQLSGQREEITTQRDRLVETVANLKTAQQQLIQTEKMASLGELTAGIAHEIQNPLNFVNNFSEVSVELLSELKEEAQAGNVRDVIAIADDLTQNLEKINHHGKRADGIVKGMLEHSRTSTGQKEPTDLNKLANEYLRLAYHGLRAKDKTFNAELITHFDESLPPVNIIPQDIGRVLLNLFNNAFYAVQQKQKMADEGYKPVLEIATLLSGRNAIISVKDNGTGIPDAIKDKILQPFFTTKPTGEGTGLGLSLSYDIVVKGHSGSVKIESTEKEGAEFTIQLPIVN